MKRSPFVIGVIAAVLVAGAAGVYGFATLFLHPAPSAVALDPGSNQPAASVGTLPAGARSTLSGGLDGTWSVDTSIGSFSDFSVSWVGYRVDETLAGNRANTAVGRTPEVTGTLVMSGTQITGVDISANVATLQSDDQGRDGQLHRQALETDQFPQATFRLTSPIDLGSLPTDGQTIKATATGALTLHGVTKTVQVAVEARLSGDVVTVVGSIEIQFSEYSIEQPVSFAILSVEDHGTMEFQLHFRHE